MTTKQEAAFPAADFDADQQNEIRLGLEAGLDASIYAKKELMAIQMHQIRLGLEEGLDVSVYARPDFDWFQMEEIRKGMLEGVNYALYADPSFDYQKMRQFRKALREDIDLFKLKQLDAGMLRQLRKGIKSRVPIVDYIKEGYAVEQLEEIRIALEKKLDIQPYLNRDFRGSAIREIAAGLEHGIDPHIYAKTIYSWQQMREIRYGLEKHLDVSFYFNPLYDYRQMHEIRRGLEDGLDVTRYRSLMYTATDMRRARERLLNPGQEGEKEKIIHLEPFVLTISEDKMEAALEIHGSKDAVYKPSDVLNFLKMHGVRTGILSEGVEALTAGKRYFERVPIAKGKPAQKGKDGWYEYFFQTNPNRKPKLLDDGSVDYRDTEWYEYVEEGQTVAVYHSAENGVPGCTVLGTSLYAPKGREQSVLSGRGFRLLEDGKTYVAAESGKIELQGHVLLITRMLVISEVTLSTGNISFDGCVHVRGNVGSGTSISATEDIIIDGFVEASVLESGGNVLLKKGINGSGSGSIRAKGTVIGNFFESAAVVSGSNIQANYSLNCNLTADGKIVIHGQKGRIAGGVAQAIRGITAYHAGNRAKLDTVIKIGLNDGIIQKQHELESQLEEIHRELTILKNAYVGFQNKYPPEVRNTMDMYLKVESAIYTKGLQFKDILKQKQDIEQTVRDIDGAKAVIYGRINEGTAIYIDNQRWDSFAVQNVTIRKKGGRVTAFANN